MLQNASGVQLVLVGMIAPVGQSELRRDIRTHEPVVYGMDQARRNQPGQTPLAVILRPLLPAQVSGIRATERENSGLKDASFERMYFSNALIR